MKKYTPTPPKAEHSPTPFKLGGIGDVTDANGIWIASVMGDHDGHKGFPTDEEGEANAEFIIRACNAHDDLLEACQSTLRSINDLKPNPTMEGCAMVLEQAIEKATGKEV